VHYTLALFLYRLAFLVLLPLIVVVLLIRSINHPAYRQRLLERLGFLSNKLVSGGIIVHAASVGEVIALKAFIEKLLVDFPNAPITVTTFTPTGSAQVKKMYGDKVQHCYLPLDIFPCTWFFLRRLKPQALVLMETELWPNLIAQCHERKIKLQLINGRLSDHSMKSYRKLTWLIKPCLQRFDGILSQSEDNQRNFLELGANKNVCQVSGNLKFDLHINDEINQKQQMLEQFISVNRSICLIASTHPGDEELAVASYLSLKEKFPELLLVIVPRHPERFDQVAQYCQQSDLNIARRSSKQNVGVDTDIWLIDTLGELLAVCGLADIVVMGGSFSNIGGHNPLEPALFKKPIVVGHDMSNFRKVTEQLMAQQGVAQLSSDSEMKPEQVALLLSAQLATLLNDVTLRENLGNNAYQVVHANQGASERSVVALKKYLVLK